MVLRRELEMAKAPWNGLVGKKAGKFSRRGWQRPTAAEAPLPPERYETDEELAEVKAKRDEYKVKAMAKKYGVPIEEMRRWLALAKEPCPICRCLPKDGRRHAIDHCHRSGKIRAPLCNRCNILVGQLENSRELLPVALAYIQRFNEALREAG